jgi:hypothetical protein
MQGKIILEQRLANQMISHPTLDKAEDVVRHLGAVQAQDYAAALWAIGLRMTKSSEDNLERAVADSTLLRTHVMRPTWHFVPPEDVRWMLKLSADRIHKQMAATYRQVEVEAKLFSRTNSLIGKALEGGKQLTRDELKTILEKKGISRVNERFGFMIIAAELEAVVCSGGRRGKQITYALLDERVPKTKPLSPEDAKAKLTWRYFNSHGPATARDFAWWAGMNLTQANSCIELIKSKLVKQKIDGQIYWRSIQQSEQSDTRDPKGRLHLLPNYDEYTVGYTERSLFFDEEHTPKLDVRGQAIFQHAIIYDGRIVGTWRRTIGKNSVTVARNEFVRFNKSQDREFTKSVKSYAKFLDLTPVII